MASRIKTLASSITSSTRRPPSFVPIFRPTSIALQSVADHCLRSKNYVNVVVAGKQPQHDWLSIDQAIDLPRQRARHLVVRLQRRGCIAGSRHGELRGDVPTLETPAATRSCVRNCPSYAARVVNVVDLMRLEEPLPNTHTGLSDSEFDAIFSSRSPGHLRLPRLSAAHPPPHAYKRSNRMTIPTCKGYNEEGTTTTPFDMVMRNGPRSLPPRHRRPRTSPRAGSAHGRIAPAIGRLSAGRTQVRARTRRGSIRDRRLEMGPWRVDHPLWVIHPNDGASARHLFE